MPLASTSSRMMTTSNPIPLITQHCTGPVRPPIPTVRPRPPEPGTERSVYSGATDMLTIDHVRKRYGTLVAVDVLSLTVRPGEVLGLLGPNGAGKSTTVNLAVGLLAPDEGRVVIEGVGNPRDPAVRARLGVAPQ